MVTFTSSPDFGASYEVTPNVRVSKLGDGYQQRQASGINTQPKTWTLQFTNRTDAEADYITTFFSDRGGVESFDWVDPNGITGKYVCMGWTRSKEAPGINSISCKFQQVFEP